MGSGEGMGARFSEPLMKFTVAGEMPEEEAQRVGALDPRGRF